MHIMIAALFALTFLAGRAASLPLDLSRYFQDDFVGASRSLSATSIVEMMPSKSNGGAPASSHRRAAQPLRQEMFQSPLVSVLYERVLPPLWSAGLRVGGPDAEYQNAASFLLRDRNMAEKNKEVVALDLSCGTGFVGIRMAESGKFDHVFALDYSRRMLDEAVAAVKRSGGGQSLPLSIIRGDAGSLPFRDGTVNAVHWGAAMHCVPDAELSMKEIYRILKPGGKLYATTFLRPFPDIVFRFFKLDELRGIAEGAGFGRGGGGELEVEALKRLYGVIRAAKGR